MQHLTLEERIGANRSRNDQAEHRSSNAMDALYPLEARPDNSRAYDMEAEIVREAHGQDAAYQRIKGITEKACKKAGITGIDQFNRLDEPEGLSEEILEILRSNPDADSPERKAGFVVDFEAYDDATIAPDTGAVGSVDIKGEAAWSDIQTYDDTGKPTNDRFNMEAYERKQSKLKKARDYHDIPELLDNAKRVRFGGNREKLIGLAIDTYKPHARIKEVVITSDSILDGLTF